jgi:hypothetical protein
MLSGRADADAEVVVVLADDLLDEPLLHAATNSAPTAKSASGRATRCRP